jgi:hypothetical protein
VDPPQRKGSLKDHVSSAQNSFYTQMQMPITLNPVFTLSQPTKEMISFHSDEEQSLYDVDFEGQLKMVEPKPVKP